MARTEPVNRLAQAGAMLLAESRPLLRDRGDPAHTVVLDAELLPAPRLSPEATTAIAMRAARRAAAAVASDVAARLAASAASANPDADTLALTAEAEKATARAAMQVAEAAARRAINEQAARIAARATAERATAAAAAAQEAAAREAATQAEHRAVRDAMRAQNRRRAEAIVAARRLARSAKSAEAAESRHGVPNPPPAAATAAATHSGHDDLARRAHERRKALEQAARRAQRDREAIEARYPIDINAKVDATDDRVPEAESARPTPATPVAPVRRNHSPEFRLGEREVVAFDAPLEASETRAKARDEPSIREVSAHDGPAPKTDLALMDTLVHAMDADDEHDVHTDAIRLRKRGQPKSKRVKINLRELFAEGYLTAERKAGVLSEEFRRIKRPLLANAYGQGMPKALNGERIMVTSALPNEGKSFCAIHLALSIASEVGTSVILVEADVAKPTVLRKLGIKAHRGLSNWCADPRIDVRDLTLDTEIEGFRVLPAGRGAPQSIDLLASRAMNTFFARLREAFPHDLIVVDAPPLLPATETKVLASLMGQVVLVVEAGETPKTVVADALDMIKEVEIIGLVLNKSLRQSKSAGYGYGYGY